MRWFRPCLTLLLPAILLLILPFVILAVLIRLLPPWKVQRHGADVSG